MADGKEVVILSGNADVKVISKPVYKWEGKTGEDRELVFRSAYVIAPPGLGEGISGLTFRVNTREFRDLSFLKGETVQKYPGNKEIRRYADGTPFMFSYESIPTFDSGDREWDSICHLVVYADAEGINMIHCRHGYKVPRIEVYIGLLKSISAFTEWLERLGCADRI